MDSWVPGELIALATFPGIIVHELAHWLACRLTGTEVHRVCLFQPESGLGFVEHAPPATPVRAFAICAAPLLVNTGVALALACFCPDGFLFDLPLPSLLLVWLALSIAMHAFPSDMDADQARAALASPQMPRLFKGLAWPIAMLMYLASRSAPTFFNLLYATIVVWVMAPAVMRMLA